MIAAAATLAAHLVAHLIAQCSGPACPDPCTECAFPPVSGENPSVPELRELFTSIAERAGAADLPAVADVEVGSARTAEPAPFPCRLLPAIGAAESAITQFCDDSGLTVISFDCGFGVMQVTSGAANYPGLEARTDVNVAAGAHILAQKWNGNESYGGQFGDSDPALVESWYFAVWAYNGFVYGNNPNNPSFPASRPPYRGPGGLSRGSYPYQEIVWGYLRAPLEKDGELVVEPLEVSYPDPTTIPDQSGLFSVDVALPEPSHADPCAEECPPSGCPPAELRVLVLDDLDASFTVEGESEEHSDGGFGDHFRSAAVAPADAPTVRARWSGTAPSSGTFDVAAFVPLDPATCTDVRVRVDACGASVAFSFDQNVPGGFFAPLGQAVLRQGDLVTVEVTNDSADPDPTHRVGIDAFRFTWRGEGDVSTCEDGGAPAAPDAGPVTIPIPTGGGCTCGSSTATSLVGALVLALAARTARRRAPRQK